jgi:hypothetical protein
VLDHEPVALRLDLANEPLLALPPLRPWLLRPVAGGRKRVVQLPRFELVDRLLREVLGKCRLGGLELGLRPALLLGDGAVRTGRGVSSRGLPSYLLIRL